MLANQGFQEPERWIAYARTHGLRPESATRLPACPNCGATRRRKLGQFVYYSHLSLLLECLECGLFATDVRLAPTVTLAHFEGAYKEDAYFRSRRQRIFEQLADHVTRAAPPQGSVLDVGGATGHLMEIVRARRPDLAITVSDLSPRACALAAERFGFDTICSDLAGLASSGRSFDVVVMSDVIYYEPDVRLLWQACRTLPTRRGALIIRIPNKLFWIRLAQRMARTWSPQRWELADAIPFFNPEHLFLFTRRFLDHKLRELGFTTVQAFPARTLRGGGLADVRSRAVDFMARAAFVATAGRAIVSPSLLVVANHDA